MKNIFQSKFLALYSVVLIILGSSNVFAAPPANDNFLQATTLSGLQVHTTGTNVEATKETGEPNHANNIGGKSVWYKWVAPKSGDFKISTNGTTTNFDTVINVYSGSTIETIFSRKFNNDINPPTNVKSYLTINVVANRTYFIAIEGWNSGQGAASGAFSFDLVPAFRFHGADYDLDGITDLSFFRPSTGTWNILRSDDQIIQTKQWGMNGDVPVITSFDSTYQALSVFRPSTGILYSRPNCCSDSYIPFGLSGDIPVHAQFGGDSGSIIGVFRPSNGMWYLYYTQNDIRYFQFGTQGDIPLPGQYSNDEVADFAVFRPSNGTWYFSKRLAGEIPGQFSAVQFGQNGDKPVPADYDGDGILDVAVFRPSTGTWWVLNSSNNQVIAFQWGSAEDIPTTGDFDGDGKFDYAVFRPSTGTWYIYRSGDNSVYSKQFGQAGDIPVTANKTF